MTPEAATPRAVAGRTPAGVRGTAARGMLWLAAGRLSARVLDQGFAIALARLLVPADFGVFALAAVFTSLFQIFAEMGLAAAIVQRPEIDDEYLSSAFWGSLGAGVVLLVLSLVGGGLIALLTGQPAVAIVVAALSTRFVLAGGSTIQLAVLSRRMEFRSVSGRELAGAAVGGVIGIVIALTGGGVWALVGQAVGMAAASAALLWVAIPWRPKRMFSWAKFKDLWAFSGPVLGARLLMYFNRNTDNLLIGRFIGPEPLGFYAFAYNILMFPINDVVITVNRVSFSALSRLSGDPARLRDGILQSMTYISMVLMPITVGIAVVAPWLLEVVFSAKWLPATGVLRILAVAGTVQSVGAAWMPALRAAGRPDLQLKWTLTAVVAYVPAFAVGLLWGIEGVAVGYLAVTALLTPLAYWFLRQVVPMGPRHIWHSQRPALLGVAAMIAGLLPAARTLSALHQGPVVILAALVGAGVILYGGTVLLVARREVRALIRSLRSGEGRSGRRAPDVEPSPVS